MEKGFLKDFIIFLSLLVAAVVRVFIEQAPENCFSAICVFSLLISLCDFVTENIFPLKNEKFKYFIVSICAFMVIALVILLIIVIFDVITLNEKVGEIITIFSLLFCLPTNFYQKLFQLGQKKEG